MNKEEKRLRENRKRNLDQLLNNEDFTARALARQMGCELNYVSQLRHGHRAISADTARAIESIIGLTQHRLDDTPSGFVSQFADGTDDLRVQQVLEAEWKRVKRRPRGALFDAMLKLCLEDAKEHGFSEGRVRFIARELLKS